MLLCSRAAFGVRLVESKISSEPSPCVLGLQRSLFRILWPERQVFAALRFWSWGCTGTHPGGRRAGETLKPTPCVRLTPPVCLLLFTFQGPQVVAFPVLFKSFWL